MAYIVQLEGAPDDIITQQAAAVLRSYRQQSEGAPSIGFLRRRAQDDTETLGVLLRSRGYYNATTTVELIEPVASGGLIVVIFKIEAGAEFQLVSHDFVVLNASPEAEPLDAARLASPVNDTATAEAIIAAEDAAVAFLRRSGYAYARFVERDAEADPDTYSVTVSSMIDAGKRYDVGEISISGARSVEHDYLKSYIPFQEGGRFNAADLPALEEKYAQTALFSLLSVSIPDEPPESDRLPITIRVEERPPRSYGLGVRFDSDIGPEVTASLSHRNLLGRNETAAISTTFNPGLISLGLDYKIPQYKENAQDLVFDADFASFSQDAFSGVTTESSIVVERQTSSRWRTGLGFGVAYSDIVDNNIPQESALFGPVAFISYDSTRNRLDPQSGNRARLDVNPYLGALDTEIITFLRVDSSVSAYRRVNASGSLTLAMRGRFGAILTQDIDNVASPQRLYSGGAGSVRGFETDSIGPRDAAGDPRGGISVLEGEIALRYRASNLIGLALFTGAGVVDDNPTPQNIGDFRQSIGAGIRFHTLLGPIRADVAAPVDPLTEEDKFQFYIALGQGF